MRNELDKEDGKRTCQIYFDTSRGDWTKHHAYMDCPENDEHILSFLEGFRDTLNELIEKRKSL